MVTLRCLSLGVLMTIVAGLAHGGPLPVKLTEVSGCKGGQGVLCDLFYPIGFSRDGKLAYIHIPADEAVGAYLWSFKIFDLVTDKVVETIDWQSAGGAGEIEGLSSLLKKKRREFEVLLGRHKIRPLANPRLRPFPIASGKGSVDAALEDEEQANPDAEPGYRSVTHHVVLSDAKGRSKRIGKLTSAESSMGPMTFAPRILGYLKSPFEPRSVVVIEQTRRGYEGPPHVSSFILMGAHLRARFKVRGK